VRKLGRDQIAEISVFDVVGEFVVRTMRHLVAVPRFGVVESAARSSTMESSIQAKP
jgi:hypothetical protein